MTSLPAASPRVLAVDDALFVHQIYRAAFRALGGATLLEAHDGVEALEKLEAEGPVDLIVLDLNMPRMDGLEFLAALKGRPRHAGTHVLVCTTEDQEARIREALRRGARSYIKKPFTLEQFGELLRRVLPTLPPREAAPPVAPLRPGVPTQR